MALFAVRRADIEAFARELEARGRASATVTRRLSTIAGFYKYAVQDELLDRSLAAHVRRPRVDYESRAVIDALKAALPGVTFRHHEHEVPCCGVWSSLAMRLSGIHIWIRGLSSRSQVAENSERASG